MTFAPTEIEMLKLEIDTLRRENALLKSVAEAADRLQKLGDDPLELRAVRNALQAWRDGGGG